MRRSRSDSTAFHTTGDLLFDRFELVESKDCWPADFIVVEGELRRSLSNCVLRIDHIGSTSVPGLASKDRIDIQITVSDLERAKSELPALYRLQFAHIPELSRDHSFQPVESREMEKLFLFRSKPTPAANLHMRDWHRANWSYALLFRDYLRADPHAARAYESSKWRLAEISEGDRSVYSYVKEAICDIVYAGAMAWAKHSGWSARQYLASGGAG